MDLPGPLRSLFGEDADDGGDPVRLGAFDATPTAGQTHRSHWEAVVPEERREATVHDLSRAAVDEGAVVEAPPLEEAPVRGFVLGDGPLHTLAVTVDGEVRTAYPLLQGVTHPFAATDLDPWDTGVDAWLSGHLDDAAVTAFAADYFADPGGYDPDGVALSALFYALDPVGEAAVAIEGPEFAGIRPWERGAPDDYVVQTVVDDVTRVEHRGLSGYRVSAPLFGDPDGRGVTAAFYLGEHLVADPPEPGDAVEGPAWLQVRRR